MSGLVEQKSPLFQLSLQICGILLRVLHAVGLGLQIRVALMLIPAGQESKGYFKLEEEAVVSEFREPVDECQDIFTGVRALNAHAAVAEGGAPGIVCGDGLHGDGGNNFAVFTRPKESAAQVVEIVIDAQQDAAVVHAADLSSIRPDLHGKPIQWLLAGRSKLEREAGGGREHFRQICLQL